MSQSGLIKIIVIGIILLLFFHFQSFFKSYLQTVTDATKKTVTEFEVDKITQQLYTDYCAFSIPFPSYTDKEWTDYIRKINSPFKIKRDPALDLWGTPMQIRNTSNISSQLPPGLIIRSAGPDRKMNTKDDISSICKKNN